MIWIGFHLLNIKSRFCYQANIDETQEEEETIDRQELVENYWPINDLRILVRRGGMMAAKNAFITKEQQDKELRQNG